MESMNFLPEDEGPVLIVGGCGHLGRHIASCWSAASVNLRIHAMDRVAPESQEVPGYTQVHRCDITNAAEVDGIISKIRPRVVVHTASPRAIGSQALEFYMKINYDGTAALLDACARIGTVKAFIYTSSSSVVHDTFSDLNNVDESAPVLYLPQQAESYNHSKAMAETLVLRANSAAPPGMLTAALRPSGLFGPSDEDEQVTGRVLASAAAGKFRVQLGDNSNFNDMTWIDNAARAHVQAARILLSESTALAKGQPIDPATGVSGEAFFITNGEPLRFWDFARSMAAEAGHPVTLNSVVVIPKWLAYPVGFVVEWIVYLSSFGTREATFNRKILRYACMSRTFDISKAKARLGYDPKAWVNMGQGMKLAMAPYKRANKSQE